MSYCGSLGPLIRPCAATTSATGLATAARWDTDPAATVAVARSIYSQLPPHGTPLWLGYKDVAAADPATAVAALSQ